VLDRRVAVQWNGEPLELAYREWPGEGPPIVLLHGLASNSKIWNLVAERLAPKWRVIALDQRGHGRSDKPEAGYDFATMVDDVRQALGRIGVERPLLVGHSWGGNVALDYAATVRPGPRALALVDGGFIELSRRMTWEEAEERLRPPQIEMPVVDFQQRMRDRLGERWSPAWEEATLGNFWVDDAGVQNLAEEWAEVPGFQGAIQAETGGTPATAPQAYVDRSPALQAQSIAAEGLTRALFFHYANDNVVPYTHARETMAQLAALGVPVSFYTSAGAGVPPVPPPVGYVPGCHCSSGAGAVEDKALGHADWPINIEGVVAPVEGYVPPISPPALPAP